MPLTSASPQRSSGATVFDFLSALARRHLAARVGTRGAIEVLAAGSGVFTLVHQRRSCGGEVAEERIAQLRALPCGSYQLYWKKGSGRWTAYCAKDCEPFLGSLDECLVEIARDPFGCYWS